MRHWAAGAALTLPGVRVVAVAAGVRFYTAAVGAIAPPLGFGLGVLRHLLRDGGRYDVVHTASFPYFSLLAAAFVRRRRDGYRIVVDWHELWTRDYWREYLGPLGRRFGWQVQRLCLRVPHAPSASRGSSSGGSRAEGSTAR